MKQLETIYAVVAQEKDAKAEGIFAVATESGVPMPLVTSDPNRLTLFKKIISDTGMVQGSSDSEGNKLHRLTVTKFTNREDLEVLIGDLPQ